MFCILHSLFHSKRRGIHSYALRRMPELHTSVEVGSALKGGVERLWPRCRWDASTKQKFSSVGKLCDETMNHSCSTTGTSQPLKANQVSVQNGVDPQMEEAVHGALCQLALCQLGSGRCRVALHRCCEPAVAWMRDDNWVGLGGGGCAWCSVDSLEAVDVELLLKDVASPKGMGAIKRLVGTLDDEAGLWGLAEVEGASSQCDRDCVVVVFSGFPGVEKGFEKRKNTLHMAIQLLRRWDSPSNFGSSFLQTHRES